MGLESDWILAKINIQHERQASVVVIDVVLLLHLHIGGSKHAITNGASGAIIGSTNQQIRISYAKIEVKASQCYYPPCL